MTEPRLNSLYLPKPPAETKVVVAMSGGVDSSVVAALLHEQGYDVVGVTLQLYDHGDALQKKGACCAGQDIHDARRVAEALGIPHYVLDYESRFKDAVIDRFAESYLAGETPIPCVSCNQSVKFHDLLQTAQTLGADALATGHYIQSRPVGDHMALFRPIDMARDQSYFLYATTQEQLDYVRFPLGGMTKDETREIARRHGLQIADKPDSQDICFVPKGRYSDIIEKLRPDAATPGRIRHVDGQDLGAHKGIIHFTIGQRRGIGLSTGEPLYVVDLKADSHEVIVGPRAALATHQLTLREVNWIGGSDLAAIGPDPMPVYAKVRSTRPAKPALLQRTGGRLVVTLPGGEEGVAPGQACVLYADDSVTARVLGGGTIDHTDKAGALLAADGAAAADNKPSRPLPAAN